jgi:hypothetical protein
MDKLTRSDLSTFMWRVRSSSSTPELLQCVRDFSPDKPLRINLDASRSVRAFVGDVISQAIENQRTAGGLHYAGAVLEHLVGAVLDCARGQGKMEHSKFSKTGASGDRPGSFLLGDVAIHVTTSPGEAVIGRCQDNLSGGYKPVIVTLQRGVNVAEGLAQNAGIGDRIDIFEIEQFVALNVYELGDFGAEGRRTAVSDIVNRYNEIVDEFETDPSLRIDLHSGA